MQAVNIDYGSIDSSSGANDSREEAASIKLNPKQSGGDYDDEYDYNDDDNSAFNVDDAETRANTAANALRLSGGGLRGGSDDDSEADADEAENETDNEGDEGGEDQDDEEDEDDEGASSLQRGKISHEDDVDDDHDDDDDDDGDDDNNDDDGDDDDDEVGDDDKFKKFNQKMRTNYLVETHPESTSHNDDEIHSLAHVVRDKTGTIIDPLHRTIPILTKYEKTRILGVRTRQLNDGAAPYVKVEKSILDGYIIAMRELDEKKIPFIVRRPLPNGGSEYWYLQDLEVI